MSGPFFVALVTSVGYALIGEEDGRRRGSLPELFSAFVQTSELAVFHEILATELSFDVILHCGDHCEGKRGPDRQSLRLREKERT